MRIWVDCTAAAHPLVLRPIIERLRRRDHQVEVTARAYGQTLGILERLGIEHTLVGRHAGAGIARKGAAVAERSAKLLRWARRGHFDLALAHGSVDLALVSLALRVPSVQMQDYEHAGLQRQISWRAARRVIVPEAIPVERMRRAGATPRKLLRYPGLKEDYYLADFAPDPAVLDEVGLQMHGIGPQRDEDERILVVVRPPPETSAYHVGSPLYGSLLDRLANAPEAVAVILPRTEGQARAARGRHDTSLIVPERAIDAQSLIGYADLVVSGGGTMNREAAALGTPVYTIFSGTMGAVDERLIAAGLLRPLAAADQLVLHKRSDRPGVRNRRDPEVLVDGVLGAVGAVE